MSKPYDQEPKAAAQEIVSFAIGAQAFCFDIAHVLEIRGWTQTTSLPHAPDYVIGMMNLRGTVLPVLDLSLRLGLGKTDPGPRHVIIIARVDDRIVGFLVDAVSDIIMVREGDLLPTPDVSSPRTQAYIRGVYAIEDRLVRALDVHQVLPQQETAVA